MARSAASGAGDGANPPARRSLGGAAPDRLERERLLALLDEAAEIVVVTAPAGFGKTTLIDAWVELHPEIHFVVVRLADVQAASGGAVGRAILEALEAAGVVTNDAALDRSLPRDGASVGDEFVYAVARAVAEAGELAIVFDDLHVLDPEVVDDLGRIAALVASPSARVIGLSRFAPPWPLGRWRVRGRLTQLSATDLAFNLEEAQAFLGVDEEATSQALDATGGWPAALELLRWAWAEGDAATRSTRTPPELIDFVIEEVVATLDDHTAQVLSDVALLGPFPITLAPLVTGAPDAVAVLTRASRSTSLIGIDDVGICRVHPLVREAMAVSIADPAELHRRAAAAWRRHDGSLGSGVAAMGHLLDAGDWGAALELIDELGPELFMASRADLVAEWLDRIPRAVIRADHEHWLVHGVWTLLAGRSAVAAKELADLATVAEPSVVAATEIARAMGVWWSLPPARGSELVFAAAERHSATAGPVPWLSMMGVHSGAAVVSLGELALASCWLLEGEVSDVVGLLERSLDRIEGTSPYLEVAIRSPLAVALAVSGYSDRARREVRTARRQMEELGARDHIVTAATELAEACLAIYGGDRPTALVRVAEATRLAGAARAHNLASAARGIEAICQTPVQLLEDVRPLPMQMAPLTHNLVLGCRARALGRIGDLAAAERELARVRPHDLLRPVYTEIGLRRRPRSQVAAWLEAHPPDDSPRAALEQQLCLAAVAATFEEARDRGLEAIEAARAGGRRGQLLFAPSQLWERLLGQVDHPDVVWAAREAEEGARMPEGPLTARELEILGWLTGPDTIAEIADRLYLSANTVKSHLRSLYRKLDVRSRTGALEQARLLGLVPPDPIGEPVRRTSRP